jgi:virginiamycin B lyase
VTWKECPTSPAITEFPAGGVATDLMGITRGPDGNVWFTDFGKNSVGRIDATGAVTTYPIPTPSSGPQGITSGSDGALWFTESRVGKIGRITVAGAITEFPLPTAGGNPIGMVAGADGNLWFGEGQASRIGRMTVAGVVTEFPSSGRPWHLTAGPDGKVWFTMEINPMGDRTIAHIDPSGSIQVLPVPPAGKSPYVLTGAPDGTLWYTEVVNMRIGHVSAAGGYLGDMSIINRGVSPYGIAAAPDRADGRVWYATHSGWIGCISQSGGTREYRLPSDPVYPTLMTVTNDGTVWFIEASTRIGRLVP